VRNPRNDSEVVNASVCTRSRTPSWLHRFWKRLIRASYGRLNALATSEYR
jgi:hypothetical protein